jgi:GT2 family glycosyltransferase
MISTRDRCRDLEVTCAKLKELRPPPDEVIVFADGCLDETAAMLRSRFPEFRLLAIERPMGSVHGRDRMLRVARGDIVLSLDDDSYPLQHDFLGRVCLIFAKHPEAAVVVFPELRNGNKFSAPDKTDESPGHYVSAYANCASAMRRGFYLQQPGFPNFFGHMYEEPDYALQCYAAGSAVWFEPSLSVGHRESSAHRIWMRRHHLNARNELWSVWLRCPWPWVTLVSAYRIARQFVYACSEGVHWAIREPQWWVSALQGLPQCWSNRRPVSWRTYRHWLVLARNPIFRAEDLKHKFPRPSQNRAVAAAERR